MPEANDSAPQLILVGGPNGAGKTTFSREFVRERRWAYLGADEIAYELSPADPYAVRMEAGRLFVERSTNTSNVASRSSSNRRSPVARSGMRFRRRKRAGYGIEMVFCFLDSPDRAVERVGIRMEKGGHFVPAEDIRRRYARSIQNFWELYRPLADRYLLAYNGGESHVYVALGETGRLDVLDRAKFDAYLAAFGGDA